MNAKRRILVSGDDGICEAIRLRRVLPQGEEFEYDYSPIREWNLFPLDGYAAFVIQRDVTALGLAVHRALRQANRYTIYEIDDVLWDLPSHSTFMGREAAQEIVLEHFRLASAVTVSTEPLRHLVLRYNPYVATILNAPPTPPRRRPRLWLPTLDAMKISDFRDHFAALVRRVVLRFDAELWLVGDVATDLMRLPPEQCHSLGVCHFAQYNKLVQALQPDLAMVPVETSVYSLCKSDIKYLDFAAFGVPAVYSNTPIYAESVTHGRTGWLADNTVMSWEETLNLALSRPEKLQEMRQNLVTASLEHQRRTARAVSQWRELLSQG